MLNAPVLSLAEGRAAGVERDGEAPRCGAGFIQYVLVTRGWRGPYACCVSRAQQYVVDNFRRFWIDQEFCALLRPQSQTAYWKLELVVATVLEWQLPTLGVCHVKPPRVIDPRVEMARRPSLRSTTTVQSTSAFAHTPYLEMDAVSVTTTTWSRNAVSDFTSYPLSSRAALVTNPNVHRQTSNLPTELLAQIGRAHV